jgi:hypothetical protein
VPTVAAVKVVAVLRPAAAAVPPSSPSPARRASPANARPGPARAAWEVRPPPACPAACAPLWSCPAPRASAIRPRSAPLTGPPWDSWPGRAPRASRAAAAWACHPPRRPRRRPMHRPRPGPKRLECRRNSRNARTTGRKHPR